VTCHTRWNTRSSYVISEAPHELAYRNGVIVHTRSSYAPGLDKWLASGELTVENVRWWVPDGGVYALGAGGGLQKTDDSVPNPYPGLSSLGGMTDSLKIIQKLREMGLHAAETGNPYVSLVGTTEPQPPTVEPTPEPEPPVIPGPTQPGQAWKNVTLRIEAWADGKQITMPDSVASLLVPETPISTEEQGLLDVFRRLGDADRAMVQTMADRLLA
jgi:hypothetical protein